MYVLAFLDRANIGFAQKALQHDTGLLERGVCLWRWRVFRRLCAVRSAEQSAAASRGRPLVDVPDHGDVGAGLGVDVFRPYAHRVLHHPFSAWRGRSWLLSWRDLLPDALVSAIGRARAVGLFYFGAPLAFIFGSPLSGLLLDLHGLFGLVGWQWLFLIEGGMATAVGVWAFWYLDNQPEDARWLEPAERHALRAALDEDSLDASAHGPRNILAALLDRRVLALSGIYLLIQMSVYGVIFYLPQQVAALLGTTVGLRVGLVAALPWLCALAVTWIVPRRADRTGGHRRWAVALLVLAGLGIGASGLMHSAAFGLARAVLRSERLYRCAAAVLDFPHPLSDGCGGGRRDCLDQLAGRDWRIYRADLAHQRGARLRFDLGGFAGAWRSEPAGGVTDRHAVSPRQYACRGFHYPFDTPRAVITRAAATHCTRHCT